MQAKGISPKESWCGILLAAGHSRRFGSNKLLHEMDGEKPMALVSGIALRAAVPEVIAVLRACDNALGDRFREHGIRPLFVSEEANGMGDSLREGISATASSMGWIVALADMPFVRAETIAAILKAVKTGACIAAPNYRGQRGHPVGFSSQLRAELLSLSGDCGARRIIDRHKDKLALLDTNDSGVLIDVDVPEALPISTLFERHK